MKPRNTLIGLSLAAMFVAGFVIRAYQPVSRSNHWHDRALAWDTAIAAQDWASTYQSRHPGVTTMAIGGAALAVYDQIRGGPLSVVFEWAAPATATSYGREIVAGVAGLALVISLLTILSVLCLKKLSNWPLALTAGVLMTLSPMYLALTRVFHVDGLLCALMVLSALLLLIYIQEQQKRYLMLSGLVGGLALLTKTPALFLLPYAGLALGVNLLLALRPEWADHAQGRLKWLAAQAWQMLALPLAIWGIFMLLPFAAWPAMWVEPRHLVDLLVGGTWDHVINAHKGGRFFEGSVYTGTPPPRGYYVSVMLIENSFVIFPLIVIGLLCYLLPSRKTKRPVTAFTFWMLLAFVFFFTVQMTIAAKQSDRYIVPVMPVLAIMAAIGAVALVDLLQQTLAAPYARLQQVLPALVLGGVVAMQALAVLPYAPNYGLSRNQLMGGVKGTYQILSLSGQNEGLIDVATYVKQLPDEGSLQIAFTQPLNVSMPQYFDNQLVKVLGPDSDYWLFSQAAFDRDKHAERWTDAWNHIQETHQQPAFAVSFDGVDTLMLYPMMATPPNAATIRVNYGPHWLGVVAWAWTAVIMVMAGWAVMLSLGKPSQVEQRPTTA